MSQVTASSSANIAYPLAVTLPAQCAGRLFRGV
jgi:hypothetical protein